MTRTQALDALESIISKKWTDAQQAYQRSRAGATSDQAKQESKYDTRGLEESYLAHGLSLAVQEYETALQHLHSCRISPPTHQVTIGSLVHCQGNTQETFFLLSLSGGGIEATINGKEVTIITPESPLGKKLLKKSPGDQIHSPPFKILHIL